MEEEEEEAEYEGEYADYEEEEGEEEQNGYELEGNVAVLDEETAVDYSAMCPGEEDMTPQGLATLKRLEAFLCNGEEQQQVINRTIERKSVATICNRSEVPIQCGTGRRHSAADAGGQG